MVTTTIGLAKIYERYVQIVMQQNLNTSCFMNEHTLRNRFARRSKRKVFDDVSSNLPR